MFHEVHVTASQHSLFRHRVQAFVTQVMARRVAEKADRCFVSVQPFIDVVDKLKRASVPVEWLPIPSNLPSSVDQKRVDCLRADLVGDRVTPLVGHFGTFGGPLRHLLLDVIERAARVYPHWRFVFIGRGSREFQRDLEIRGVLPPGRSASSGGLAAEEAAHWISACDVMVQPYPDGVSTKRGSLMASLALGMPTVSNLGSLSDSLWQDCSGLMLADKAEAGEIVEAVAAILSDVQLRSYLQAEAAKLYARCFSSEHTICRLEAASVPATVA
jgi:glycosyltransferase involved in cell wall biosynthesis